MSKKKNTTSTLAELLPDGLDDSLIESISKLLSEKVNEEVSKVKEEQTRKTLAFIRANIDKLKEQAMKELELENETFRNAQLFETVRSIFAVELTGDDELNAINTLASISESHEQKNEVLVKEIDRLLEENSKLSKNSKILSDRNQKLSEQVTKLTEAVTSLKETTEIKAKSKLSDRAIVVSEKDFRKNENDSVAEKKNKLMEMNEWLTPSVMEALKALSKE